MKPNTNFKRSRGRSNRRPQGSNNRSQGGGNAAENRVRGNASQVLEKYLGLARDAQASGDRVTAEYYFQHADHYYRIVNANGAASGRSQDDGARTPDNAGPENSGPNNSGPNNSGSDKSGPDEAGPTAGKEKEKTSGNSSVAEPGVAAKEETVSGD